MFSHLLSATFELFSIYFEVPGTLSVSTLHKNQPKPSKQKSKVYKNQGCYSHQVESQPPMVQLVRSVSSKYTKKVGQPQFDFMYPSSLHSSFLVIHI